MPLQASSQAVKLVPPGLTAWDWIHAGIGVVLTAIVCLFIRRAVGRMARAEPERIALRIVERILVYVVVVVGALCTLSAVRVQIGPLVGALGIGGVAVAFAMQDTLQNLVAGVILQARRPFRRGDQVRIDTFEGVVDDIDLRNVALVTFDGLNVFVPNKTVLENPIVNYTRTPTRRTQLSVGIAYGADLEKVQGVLLDAVTRTPGVESWPVPGAWVTGFGDSAVTFEVLFWHVLDRASVWQVRSDVAMNVKAALDAAGIVMPYPQRTVWLRGEDPGAGDSPPPGEPREPIRL